MVRRLFIHLLCALWFVPASMGADASRLMRSVRGLQQLGTDGELHNVCTTTAIGDGYTWLTAAHCGAAATYIDGEPTLVVFRDQDLDLMVLRTVDIGARPLRMQDGPPHVGQTVQMLGHPVGLLAPQFFQGHISSLETIVDGALYTMFDLQACGGNSGSAVVNTHDEIVSVLQIGFGRPCSGFSGGALWRDVAAVVWRYGQSAH